MINKNVTHLDSSYEPSPSGLQGDGSQTGLLNGTVKPSTEATEESIVRKCLAMTRSTGGVEEEMCSVESPDGMSTGK